MSVAIAAVLLTVGAPTAIADASQVQLAPHRAVYDVDLVRTNATAGVTGLKGRLAFELKGSACKGYEQVMRFVTRTVSNDGRATLSDMRSSYGEPVGGETLTFKSETFRDRRLSERTEGKAAATDKSITVAIRRPAPKTIKKEDGAVLFPVAHARALITAAINGKSVFTADLFDGAEKGEKFFRTTAAIGKRADPGRNTELPQADGGDVLNDLRAWPISLSYFDRAKTGDIDGVPDYELAYLMFENGVARRLFIDYGTFAIKGRLVRLEMLEPPKC
ncbi:MAG: DUF1849 family protein [Pseudomonadota bacterium]